MWSLLSHIHLTSQAAAFISFSVFLNADRDDGSVVFDVVNEDDSVHNVSDDDDDDDVDDG